LTPFSDRLRRTPPLLLDGPMGTELSRRGVDTSLPLWSARALLQDPDAVARIHADHVAAGAEIVTTNTFRTHRRSLAQEGVGEMAAELTALAVRLARQAAEGATPRPGLPRRYVAGSIAPLEDCYSPDLTPPHDELLAEHGEMVENLVAAGVDLLLLETMPTIREAAAAAMAAVASGVPVLAGLTCGSDGRLLSGESVTAAARTLEPLGVHGLLINCTPADVLEPALQELALAASTPIGAYGNVGHAESVLGWANTDVLDPDDYLRYARRWLNVGAHLVGCCCGTRVEHVQALRRFLDAGPPTETGAGS